MCGGAGGGGGGGFIPRGHDDVYGRRPPQHIWVCPTEAFPQSEVAGLVEFVV